jgi:hypothetical protein
MQNPGQGHPIRRSRTEVPVILGLWREGARPALVAFDARRRFDQETRKSFFVSLPHLAAAATSGWASYRSGSDEEVYVFWPQLLPAYIEIAARGVRVEPDIMRNIIEAAGMDDGSPLKPEERVRRTTSALVRRAAFSREVVTAYGRVCAMCALDFGLVQGAHIFPASAPGSSDDVRNGVSLCGNHHAAFDQHLVYVDPKSREIVLHPNVLAGRTESEACEAFVTTTLPVLRSPRIKAALPRAEMFVKRYGHFASAYDWAA